MSAEDERDDDRRRPWTPDPCEPGIVPGGRRVRLICGRVRTSDGEHILDTQGGSG